MIKRFHKHKEEKRYYRINERIVALELRVLDSEGKQVGVLKKFEALQYARDLGLDLVEVAPNAKPPVARIVDFNKFLYQQEKKKREEKKKAKVSETKEVRLGPNMGAHDLDTMTRRARDFLEDNDKVRLVVRFAGRQIVHPENGRRTLNAVISALSEVSKVEKEAHFEGKKLITIITPDKKKQHDPTSSPEGLREDHAPKLEKA